MENVILSVTIVSNGTHVQDFVLVVIQDMANQNMVSAQAPQKKSIPVEKPVDKYCAEYCWMDSHKKVYAEWFKGCVKVCKCCVKGYYLDCDNICVKLPKHCEEAYPDGTCKCCKKGYELC